MTYIPYLFYVVGSNGRLKQPTKRQLFEMLLMAIEFQNKRIVHVTAAKALSKKNHPKFVPVHCYPSVYSVSINEIGYIDNIRYISP